MTEHDSPSEKPPSQQWIEAVFIDRSLDSSLTLNSEAWAHAEASPPAEAQAMHEKYSTGGDHPNLELKNKLLALLDRTGEDSDSPVGFLLAQLEQSAKAYDRNEYPYSVSARHNQVIGLLSLLSYAMQDDEIVRLLKNFKPERWVQKPL